MTCENTVVQLELHRCHNAFARLLSPTISDDTRAVQKYVAAGRTVKARREALGLAQGEAGPSAATWRKVENGRDAPYAARTVTAICQALGWTLDSYDRVLEGGEPTLAAVSDDHEGDLQAAVRELTEVVRQLRADLREGRR